ncbi:16246_t:CDS:2, partial [Dentiscutata erythropus]
DCQDQDHYQTEDNSFFFYVVLPKNILSIRYLVFGNWRIPIVMRVCVQEHEYQFFWFHEMICNEGSSNIGSTQIFIGSRHDPLVPV